MSSKSKVSPKNAPSAKTEVSSKKTSPKKVVVPVSGVPERTASEVVPITEQPTLAVEKTLTQVEIDTLNHYLNEENRGRIVGTDHLDYWISRQGPADQLTIPEGFEYTSGFAARLKNIFSLIRIVTTAGNKDAVDYVDKFSGEKKTITRAELRNMERGLISELKKIPQMLEHGMVTEERRRKNENSANRLENQVRESRRLMVFKKEIAAVLKGAIGKTPALDSVTSRKTRTSGVQDVYKYKFLNTALDGTLSSFRKGLPLVRSSIVGIMMLYVSEAGIHPKVKKGDVPEYFSMPSPFVAAYKKISKGADATIDPSKMTLGEIQRMISAITEPYTKELSEEERQMVIQDFELIRLAREALRQEREAKKAAAASSQ